MSVELSESFILQHSNDFLYKIKFFVCRVEVRIGFYFYVFRSLALTWKQKNFRNFMFIFTFLSNNSNTYKINDCQLLQLTRDFKNYLNLKCQIEISKLEIFKDSRKELFTRFQQGGLKSSIILVSGDSFQINSVPREPEQIENYCLQSSQLNKMKITPCMNLTFKD